jgi:hypothetical protein
MARIGLFVRLTCTILVVGVASFSSGIAIAATNCEKLSDRGSKDGVYIPGDDAGRVVIGHGRLQFFSAPDLSCRIKGLFIVEGQAVDAYTEYKGFTSIAYLDSKSQSGPVTGWVKTDRLKPTGKGIAPHQDDSGK